MAVEREVEIAEFNANAMVKKAEGDKNARVLNAHGDAQAKVLNAKADANVFSVVDKAKAENTLAEARIPLVPQIMVGGGGSGNDGGNSLVNVLLASLVAKNLDGQPVRSNAPVTPERK